MGKSAQEEAVLATITLVSASLSLCGGFALLITYNKIPSFQTSVRKLLVFLTIADIFTAFGYIIGTINFLRLDNSLKNSTDPMCEVQSFITTFSSLSSFAWTSIIAFHLYALIRAQRDFERNIRLKFLYHIIGWVFPAIICIPILAKDHLGRDNHSSQAGTGLWCWIKIDYKEDNKIPSTAILLMFVSGKLWELLTYVLSFSVYMLLKIDTYIKRQKNKNYHWSDEDGANLRDEDERFCFTWLILYLLRFWGTIGFFLAVFNTGGNARSVLRYLQCAGDGSQALGNFILFCVLDKNIRQKYREQISDCCHRRRNYELLET